MAKGENQYLVPKQAGCSQKEKSLLKIFTTILAFFYLMILVHQGTLHHHRYY
jgi:hypothetical protein